jgi:hypothetical protein
MYSCASRPHDPNRGYVSVGDGNDWVDKHGRKRLGRTQVVYAAGVGPVRDAEMQLVEYRTK